MSYDRRWTFGVPIVTFWLVMMGLLAKNELGVKRPDAEASPRHRLREATESWLGVFLAEGREAGPRRVGHVHLRQTPEDRAGSAGTSMVLEAEMSLDLLNKQTELGLSGSIWQAYDEPRAGVPRAEFDFAVRSAGYDFGVEGVVADGGLRGEITSAGETLPLELPVDEGLIFSSGLGSALSFPRLEVGDEYRLETFDPLTLSKGQARVKCTARETLRLSGESVETCRLKVTMSGLSSLAWIDAAGEVVRAETPVGLVLERITPAEARVAPQATAGATGRLDRTADLLDHTAIRPTGRRPFRSARAMEVRLGGLEDLELPEDRVQTSLGDGRYRLRTPAVPATADTTAAPDPDRFLAADAFVQSDHPKIQRQAAEIVGREADPWQRARAIHDWVFARLDKEPVISIPSALEVLEQRRGDCNEHTVLFAALARAAGLPARIAIGVVWSDELEGFYYHAWPEVHVGDWVWMDPTLDQPLADATHVKLRNGGIETWPRLLPYLGQLEVEILDVE